jgi:hypothetical protein
MGEERASQPVIDPDVPIEELVQILPQAPAILRRFGIVCIQCGEPVWGTLREVAAAKGISDLGEVMAALGAAAGSGESSGR